VNAGRFVATTKAQLQMTFRRRVTLFWSLFFPIILMGALGLLFGGQLNAGKVAVVPVDAAGPRAVVHVLDDTKGVTVKRAESASEAVHQVRTGSRDAAVVFVPAPGGGYVARLYTSNTSADQAASSAASSSGRPTGLRSPPPAGPHPCGSRHGPSTRRRSRTSTSSFPAWSRSRS